MFTGIKGCASLGFSDRFGKYRWGLERCDLRLPFVCQTAACVEGDFRCADGRRCVSLTWVCDGVKDCDDGSDEAQCGQGKFFHSKNIVQCRTDKVGVSSDNKLNSIILCNIALTTKAERTLEVYKL